MDKNVLKAKIRRLMQTGILNFVGDETFTEKTLQEEEYSKNLFLIKDLNVSHTSISTLEGIGPMHAIKYFTANYTNMKNFVNFLSIKNCSSISLKNTPLYSHKHLKLILVILFGETLVSINGAKIPDSIFKMAKKYDPVYAHLINAGWEFEKRVLT